MGASSTSLLAGGGAHAYRIERVASDPFQSKEINYHYLLAEMHGRELKIEMIRLRPGQR